MGFGKLHHHHPTSTPLSPSVPMPKDGKMKGITSKMDLGRDVRPVSLILTLSLLSVACSGGGEVGGQVSGSAALPAPPAIRDSAGITIIENAEP